MLLKNEYPVPTVIVALAIGVLSAMIAKGLAMMQYFTDHPEFNSKVKDFYLKGKKPDFPHDEEEMIAQDLFKQETHNFRIGRVEAQATFANPATFLHKRFLNERILARAEELKVQNAQAYASGAEIHRPNAAPRSR